MLRDIYYWKRIQRTWSNYFSSWFPMIRLKMPPNPKINGLIKQIITRDREISAPITMLNLSTECGVNIACNLVINQKSCHGVSGSSIPTGEKVPNANQLNKFERAKYHH